MYFNSFGSLHPWNIHLGHLKPEEYVVYAKASRLVVRELRLAPGQSVLVVSGHVSVLWLLACFFIFCWFETWASQVPFIKRLRPKNLIWAKQLPLSNGEDDDEGEPMSEDLVGRTARSLRGYDSQYAMISVFSSVQQCDTLWRRLQGLVSCWPWWQDWTFRSP